MRRQGKVLDCSKCNKVELLPENNVVYYLLSRYGDILIDRKGNINVEGIKLALELEEMKDKALIAQKLIVYFSVAHNTQSKELK